MNERALYPEIEHTLDYYDIFWHKNQDFRFANNRGEVTTQAEADKAIAPRKSDPDFTMIRYPLGLMLEVKKTDSNTPAYFPFSKIEPHQRLTLNRYGGCSSWLWLYMGRNINSVKFPRAAWLIRWNHWLNVETHLQEFDLRGINYYEPHRLDTRGLGLGASDLLASYRLSYVHDKSKQRWEIPVHHSFWTLENGLSSHLSLVKETV